MELVKIKNIKDINTIWLVIIIGMIVGIASIIKILILPILLIIIGNIRSRHNIIKNIKYFIIIFLIMYLVIMIFNIKYDLFPQAKHLLGASLIQLIIDSHPHSFRYLVAYPAIIVHEVLNIDLTISYTMYCLILLSIMNLYINRIINILKGQFEASYSYRNIIISTILTTIIMLMMNGRLIPAYTGIVLIIYSLIKLHINRSIKIKDYMYISMGFLLSTVSSGVMMVSFFQIVLGICVYVAKHKKYLSVFGLITISYPIINKCISYVYYMSVRNINYFGGGIDGFFNMLVHGLGKYIYMIPNLSFYKLMSITIIMIVGIVSIIFIYTKIIQDLRQNYYRIYLYMSIPIGITCGLFGISTATMIIPSIIIIVNLWIEKIINNKTAKEFIL